uniref:AN1-type zinc finger protein 6 n=2 Tax=Suricata suricatta TaxID=37032 RepID=A0A673TL93_SURSU
MNCSWDLFQALKSRRTGSCGAGAAREGRPALSPSRAPPLSRPVPARRVAGLRAVELSCRPHSILFRLQCHSFRDARRPRSLPTRCAQRNMAQETNHSQAPMLCSTGCGFYGNPRTNGMCSVCYREHLQRQNSSNGRISPPAASVTSLSESFPVQRADGSAPDAQSPLDPAPASAQPSPVSNQSLLSESVASSQADGTSVEGAPDTEDLPASVSDTAQQPSEEQSESLEKPKQRKNRCFMCRKKVGLTGFECRCGHVYCGVHRYSDVHNCSYNYKADAAEKIRKENPVVVGEKIQKI